MGRLWPLEVPLLRSFPAPDSSQGREKGMGSVRLLEQGEVGLDPQCQRSH